MTATYKVQRTAPATTPQDSVCVWTMSLVSGATNAGLVTTAWACPQAVRLVIVTLWDPPMSSVMILACASVSLESQEGHVTSVSLVSLPFQALDAEVHIIVSNLEEGVSNFDERISNLEEGV